MAKAFPKGPAYRPGRTSTDSNQVIFSGQHLDLVAGDLTLNKLLGDVRVPKGAELLGAYLWSADLDSGAGLMMSLGDAGDAARFLAAANVGQAGGLVQALLPAAFGYTFPEETLVQVKITVVPVGAVAGALKYGVMYVSN